jgi:ribonuclease G
LAALQDFCAHHVPKASRLLEHYSGELPLFELHGVEDGIRDALDRRVELQCGGYLIFDQSESMTVIDVNTGSFVGQRNQDDTFLEINLQAVEVLARQLRLRNLGGIIIVDFINMEKGDHRRQVHDALTKSMQGDSALGEIAPFSKLGLIEMTRKRTSESLEGVLCEDCVVCHGRGVIKKAEAVCCDIFRKIICDAQTCTKDKLMLHVAASVASRLLNEEAQHFFDLQQSVGKTISVEVDLSYSQEHFVLLPF